MNKRLILEKKREILKLKEQRNRLLKEQKANSPKFKAQQVRKLLEAEIERAELILATKDIVNQLQDMAEKLAKMQVEDIMPIVDQMRGEFSPDQAESFDTAVTEQLNTALENVKTAREQINNQVLKLEGKLTDEDMNDMAKDDGMPDLDTGEEETDLDAEMGAVEDEEGDEEGDEDQDMIDIFGGSDDDGEVDEEPGLGRAKKESFNHRGSMIKESKKKG